MQAMLRSAWQAQPLAVGLPARPRPNNALPRTQRGLPEMVPYQAEFPVADRTTLGSAVTKALGVAEHVCLLSALRRWWPCIELARPIDSETMGMKQPSQSYAGKHRVSKKHQSNYTRVYDRDASVREPVRRVWQEPRGRADGLPLASTRAGGGETMAKPSAGQRIGARREGERDLAASARLRVGRPPLQLNRGLAALARGWVSIDRACDRDNRAVPDKDDCRDRRPS